jgi:hypothetical protein
VLEQPSRHVGNYANGPWEGSSRAEPRGWPHSTLSLRVLLTTTGDSGKRVALETRRVVSRRGKLWSHVPGLEPNGIQEVVGSIPIGSILLRSTGSLMAHLTPPGAVCGGAGGRPEA